MSAARELPARPSLDSLRKQAKKLAREAAAGNSAAIARIEAQLPRATSPLSHRDAQLVIAREYGFRGWPELIAEVENRLGRGLAWAFAQAKVAMHDQDHDRLGALLREYPAVVSWRDENGDTLSSAIAPYALDVSDPERERTYTRPRAAEMLIDAGMVVERETWEYLIHTGASGMLHLLARKNVLPRTLPIAAALGDEEAVRSWLGGAHGLDGDAGVDEQRLINRALMNACRFRHADIAKRLLERAVALDPDLGRRIDRWQGRHAFVDFLIQHTASWDTERPETTPWQAFVIRQLTNALDHDDLPAFRRWLEDEPWLLQPSFVHLQIKWIERASYGKHKAPFITALFERDAALLGIEPPPPSWAITYALSYGNAHLVPLLTRVWRLPNDLPHAAGTGEAAAVARWFDADGKAVLGPLEHHYPANDPKRNDLGWRTLTAQQVLDVALAWSVLNGHFEIASFLLERGANIDTNWGTHEPASILHEAAIQGNEPAARFLIDHGADLTIEDYRYRSTAEGWARYGARDERMADILAAAAAERRRE